MIPEHTMYALNQYVKHGQPVGGFLEAVLTNDLVGAFDYADDEHQACMLDLLRHIRLKIPARCWGDRENLIEWIKHRGLEQIPRK